jgi:hypothetical protein
MEATPADAGNARDARPARAKTAFLKLILNRYRALDAMRFRKVPARRPGGLRHWLVRRRYFLHVVDHQHLNGRFPRFQLQPEILVDCRENGRPIRFLGRLAKR